MTKCTNCRKTTYNPTDVDFEPYCDNCLKNNFIKTK